MRFVQKILAVLFSFAHIESARRLLSAFMVLVSVMCVLGCNAELGRHGKKRSGSDSGAGAGESCAVGTVDCAGQCVATATDSGNCGACGVVCDAGQYCEAGVCTGFCSPGENACGGVCLETTSDPLNCGGCGVLCPVGQFCDAGACSATCTGSLCLSASGVDQCAHLQTNGDHCGACGVKCAAGQACEAGACVVACPGSRVACGAECVEVRTDAANCGSCGVGCDPGVACVEGACGESAPICTGGACLCTAAQQDCNGTCVATQTNVLHCGACNLMCKLGQECVAGACQCPLGGTLCGETCANTLTDNNNCGACGTACSGGTSCTAGVCICGDGLTECNDTCVDTQMDAANCGACGTACASYEACVAGICKYDADQCGGEARGISMGRISLYQGVEVDVFRDGLAVPSNQMAVDIIQGRDAMMRIFVTPDGGFAARELSARVFVENDGDIQVFFHKRVVSGASTQNSLESTFVVDVPGEVIRGETKYWVELAECGALPTTSVGTVRFPTTPGVNAFFEARETGVIKVVFIPFTHDGRVPDTSAGTMAAYASAVESQYPAVKMEWSVGGGLTSGQSGTSIDLGPILDKTTSKRAADAPADDVYYYGLIDPASSFNTYCNGGCTTGLGWVPDAEGGWASGHRAAVGVGFQTWGAGTFAHELGHNHGRNHAPCGGASGTDTDYPYSGAKIGKWGYDLEKKELKDPAVYTDFMGYCRDTWVSDYSYNAYADRIAILNGADGAQAFKFAPEPTTVWQRILVTPNGAQWTSEMSGPGAPTQAPEVGIVLDEHGNVIAQVDVHRMIISDGGGYMLFVPGPEPSWFAVGIPGGPILAY